MGAFAKMMIESLARVDSLDRLAINVKFEMEISR